MSIPTALTDAPAPVPGRAGQPRPGYRRGAVACARAAGCILSGRPRAARGAGAARARAGRHDRARCPRQGAGPRRVDRCGPRDAAQPPSPRASSRAPSRARSRPARSTVPADLPDQIEAALRARRSNGWGWRRVPARCSPAPRSRGCRPQGQHRAAVHAARCGGGRQSQARSGAARRRGRQGAIGGSNPGRAAPYCRGAGARKCGTYRDDRACAAARVADAIGRWQGFIGPDDGLDLATWVRRGHRRTEMRLKGSV